VQNRIGECSFWHERQFYHTPLPVDQRGGILITAESRSLYRAVVGDDEIEPFCCQLVFCIGNQIVGLGGETNHELCGTFGREGSQDVRGLLEIEGLAGSSLFAYFLRDKV